MNCFGAYDQSSSSVFPGLCPSTSIRRVFYPADLFHLSPDPHHKRFQPFNDIASVSLMLQIRTFTIRFLSSFGSFSLSSSPLRTINTSYMFIKRSALQRICVCNRCGTVSTAAAAQLSAATKSVSVRCTPQPIFASNDVIVMYVTKKEDVKFCYNVVKYLPIFETISRLHTTVHCNKMISHTDSRCLNVVYRGAG